MSHAEILPIPIKPNEVRDFMITVVAAVNYTVDLLALHIVVGLDVFIHNRGAAALTIAIDGQPAITVLAGDSFNIDNTKFSLVVVTSAVAYDLIMAGIYVADRIR